jgi:tol-pal system protein YbgF
MNRIFVRPLARPLLRALSAAAMLAMMATAGMTDFAAAQEQQHGFLDNLFGRSSGAADRDRPGRLAQDRTGQADPSDVMVRLDRLEGQIRQLTGAIEQLQFRNQQLESQLRRMLEEAEYRSDAKGGAPAVDPSRSSGTPPAAAPAMRAPMPAAPPIAPSRRSDVFDPNQNPNAPGAPRVLGSIPSENVPPAAVPGPADDPSLGAPGGRAAGAPLDLSTLAGRAPSEPVPPPSSVPSVSGLPSPAAEPPRNPGTQVATVPPSDSPKDNYDLAYGYILHRDYALAEDGFRMFLRKFPSDRMAPEAQYWLGESLFQRQRYRDAAEAFLNVSTKYDTSAKAPDALLRLGQSLAALEEKEAACAALGEIQRKYPRAPVGVKQGVEREQKRVHC